METYLSDIPWSRRRKQSKGGGEFVDFSKENSRKLRLRTLALYHTYHANIDTGLFSAGPTGLPQAPPPPAAHQPCEVAQKVSWNILNLP